MSSTTNWQKNFTNFLKGRGKIQQLAELTAVQQMEAIAKDNLRNMQAESAEVRRSLWGGDENKTDESEDMGTTILGDVTYPAPVVISQPQQQNNSAIPLMLGMLASGLIGGGAAGVATYLMTKQPAPAQQTFEDETVQIGLGRIEDYLGADE
jgi:hypothetical protein